MFGSNFPSVILFERNLTALRLRRIPFTIEAPIDPFYSESNMERLHHSFRQAEEGKDEAIIFAGRDRIKRHSAESRKRQT